ncbi:MAG: ArnT family glycosyltransferase, partial [Candidatus Heimdallarchaeota archaeon]
MSARRKQSKLRKSLSSEYLILALIVALGLALRLYHLQFYLDNGGLDSMWYTHAGVKYSNGDWLTPRTTAKGPLLTLLLGLSMRIFGPTYMVTKFVSLIAGSLLPIIVFFLGSELFGKRVGLLSALIISINPLLIFYHGLVYRETLYALTWTSCIYFALRGFKGNTLYSIIGGVFFAFSSVTIELGIFAGMGFVLYFLFQKFLRSKEIRKVEYKNLDIFFLSGFLTLIPFIARNYLAYNEPFIQWRSLEFLEAFVPIATSTLMWVYVGLMALSIPYALVFKVFRVRFRRRHQYSLNRLMSRHTKTIKISLFVFSIVISTLVIIYEVFKGPGPAAKVAMGLIKLLEVLAFPESMGFLLILSVLTLIYVARSSSDVVLILFALLFSAAGVAWGITTHYGHWVGLSFDEILAYLPYSPLDNAFRYVSSYIPLLTIFAGYGIFLLAEKSTRKLIVSTRKKAKKTRVLKTVMLCALISAVLFQFVYADMLLRVKARRDINSLQKRYEIVVNWLSKQGSPAIYGFNPMLKEVYGEDRVVLLSDESLTDIAQRASDEKIKFIVSDIFGAYSDAQLAL